VTPPVPLARTLRSLADLAEIRGAFAEGAALRRAGAALETLHPSVASAPHRHGGRDPLDEIPGVGPAVAGRLRALAAGGADSAIAAAQSVLPVLLRRFLERRILATDEAVTLVRHLGILTLADLQIALDDGRVRQTGGESLETRLRHGADTFELERRPIPLGRARDILDSLLAMIAAACPALDLVIAAGDVRRFESLVSSLVIVGRSSDPPVAVHALCTMTGVEEVLHRSARRAILLFQDAQGGEVDIRVAAPDEYGTVLFAATGSRAHVNAMQKRRGRPKLTSREEDLYAQTGLPLIPPELRQGAGEIEAAAAGALPSLISRDRIRGDLHMHTTYSDGADVLDAMVAECCALGYEYIAITDHSERAGAARTLSRADLARQRDEIASVRERYPQIAILHGIEADIMPDGRLDFPDDLLEPLDVVLASLHDAAGHDARTLTRRCLQAIRHPLVTIITHPSNRIVGRRPEYVMDYDAIYAAAAETGTALEVDGAPSHLDLDGDHARAAVAAGVTVAIDSDCHRARLLGRQMLLGIGTARRGWVQPRHVLNARPLEDVRTFIAAKRAR
jgi:DNA polymerase (family 10)